MAGTRPTQGHDGNVPGPWAAIARSLQGASSAAQATALQTNGWILDAFQNCCGIQGALNQVVTIGAGWLTYNGSTQPVMGVEVGTGLSGFGIAYPSNFAHTTCTISAANQSASQIVVASATGLAVGMVIGATEMEPPPSLQGQSPPNYIAPGSAITAISGTTITLSIAPKLPSSAPLYCCACNWTELGSAVHP